MLDVSIVRHRSVAAGSVVCVCVVYSSWFLIGWLTPMNFWLPHKQQVLMGKQWSNQSVKLSPNCLIATGEKPSYPTWGCTLSAMLQILIFSFFEESWNVSLAKLCIWPPIPPAAKGTLLRGGGGLIDSAKKGKFVTKIFLSVNMQNEVIKYCEIFYKYLKYCY